MILVNLNKSWPEVLAGRSCADKVTLEAWALVADGAIETYGDVICGVYQGSIVSAFDITGNTRDGDGRVLFQGVPSAEWAHLVGEGSPVTWVRGQARPVKYLDSRELREGTVEIVKPNRATERAVIGQYVLDVRKDGTATLTMPAGAAVTVVTRPAAS